MPFAPPTPDALAVLAELLAPEQLDRLRAGEAVSAAARVTAAAALRAELAGLISYLPPALARRRLAEPRVGAVDGRFWTGTALFADLSGFTALSSALGDRGKQGAEEISAIINTLFDALLAEVDQRAGNLLKFGGDALTAFFGADDLGDAHAALACDAALAMQRAMGRFAAMPTRVGQHTLALRIGVHSGRVFAVEVGDRTHLELVVTGQAMNRVALAQELARPGEVVISPEALALVPGAAAEPGDGGFMLLRSVPAPPAPSSSALAPVEPGRADDLAALAQRVGALRPYLPRNLPARFVLATGAESGEFRPVTVLFANVYDFSPLLERLGDDVATATATLNAYYSRAQAAVHRYGGAVNKVDMYTRGDKLMALFGAPVAHEDDPLRAVRCALDLSAALEDANDEGETVLRAAGVGRLHQKIGLNTGVVFAGRIGSARRHEYTVMGSAVNLAARLMAVAADGAVALSPATSRAVAGRVALRELPPATLKGIPAPVPITAALYVFDHAAKAARPLERGRLVDREGDLAALLAAGRAAAAGSGQVVALVGEPGAGKSRLAEEAVARLSAEYAGKSSLAEEAVGRLSAEYAGGPPPLVLAAECQGYEQRTPYAAVRELLRQLLAVDLGPTAPPEALVAQIAAVVPELARFAPLAGDILGAALPESALTAALNPEQRRDNALALCLELLLRSAHARPLIILVDDLQWADASTLAALTALAARAGEAALLLLLLYRPDSGVEQPWLAHPHARALLLGELSAEGTAGLAASILGTAPPPELLAALERAQGNPFFVEELVRSLVERSALRREGEGWVVARPLDAGELPDSIESLIVARLDRLEERSRALAQVASVIGRRFRYDILGGLIRRRLELRPALEAMLDATLLLPDELERELAYLFKHILTRDVAYESILFARRHELHRRVAQQIERLYAGRLDEHLALLARHFTLAQSWPEAFDYHLRAGRDAQRRFANVEGVALLRGALEAARQLDLPAAAVSEVHERLGWLHTRLGDYGAALSHFLEALAPLSDGRDPDASLRLHHHVARVHEKRADFGASFAWVERALALPGADERPVLVRCVLLGAGLHMRQGRLDEAQSWGERALTLGERHANPGDQAQALKLLGNLAVARGDTAAALDLLEAAVALYGQADDPDGLAFAFNDLATVLHDLGRLAEARAHYEEAARLKEELGEVYGQAMVAGNLGVLLADQGDLAGAIAQYGRAVAGFERIGSPYGAGLFRMNRGAALLRLGELDAAEAELDGAAATFAAIGSEEHGPELERLVAELALRRGRPEAAVLAERALTTAQRQEARLEEGITLRLLAEIQAGAGELAAAWAELERSLALLREAEAALEVARTQLARAALAHVLGRPDDGAAALAEALAAAEAVGAGAELAAARNLANVYAPPDQPPSP